MAASLPNGTIYSLATTYAAAKTVTVATNAAPPVLTSTAHGYSNGDIILVNSGWLGLNDRAARVAAVTTDTFTLEGYDCTNTTNFPAGTGIGTVTKVATWTQISQVQGSDTTGGEQQSVEWVWLEDGTQRSKPTYKNAKTLTLLLSDDYSLAWNAVLAAADLAGTGRILRAALPSGSYIYYNMYVGFDGEPKIAANQINTVSATFKSVAKLIRYAS